jgi:hypothetical protein
MAEPVGLLFTDLVKQKHNYNSESLLNFLIQFWKETLKSNSDLLLSLKFRLMLKQSPETPTSFAHDLLLIAG